MVSKEAIIPTMMREGIKEYPREACGLIVARGKHFSVEVCRNVASNQDAQFIIAHEDYLAATENGQLVGVWHTHPDCGAHPTEADLAGVEVTGVPWFIVSIAKRDDVFIFSEPTVSEPKGIAPSYLERPYILGTFDCYSIIRDYFCREFGIILGDYPRVLADGTPGNVVFKEMFKSENFHEVTDEPRVGDCFLINGGKAETPTHVAIYIGGDTILHHCVNRLSREETYSGYWRDHTLLQLRHAYKC